MSKAPAKTPPKLRFLDFETYYADDYTLSKMTPEEYVRDPRFQTIGFSIRTDYPDAPAIWVTGDDDYIADKIKSLPWDNTIIVGHNMSEFDSLILSHHYGVVPKFYQCTLQMARSIHGIKSPDGRNISNSLGALCKMYGLPDKGNEVIMAKNKRREDFTPAQLAAYGQYCITDTELCRQLYHLLRKKLPGSEMQIMHLFTRMFADARLELDGPLLTSMLTDLVTHKEKTLARVADMIGVDNTLPLETRLTMTQTELRSDGAFAKILDEMFDVEPPRKFSPKRKNADGSPLEVYAFAKTDEAMQELADDEDEDIQALVAARLGAKSTQAETRMGRFIGIESRGPLPVPLVYGKTHTHRAAGGGKINLQNLPRVKSVDEKVKAGTLIYTPDGYKRALKYNALQYKVMTQDKAIYRAKDCRVAGLRDAIVAPPGKVIVVADSSNIELRVCHLLAGQMDTIAKIRAGVDLYCDLAEDFYGYPVNKSDHPKQRQHGKVGHLQLQFQSGGGAFRKAARVMGGIRLTQEEADNTVKVYRAKHAEIRKFWRKAEKSITSMVNGTDGYIDQWGLLRTAHNQLVMPNGMALNYFNLRQHQFEDAEEGDLKWVYDDKEARRLKTVYGGAITENVVQALARNVVFEQMMLVEKEWGGRKGCGVALTVHDEVVAIVDEADGEDCLAHMLGVMGQPPVWWKELPVTAEGGIGHRYADAK